jgi:hypothetical protein
MVLKGHGLIPAAKILIDSITLISLSPSAASRAALRVDFSLFMFFYHSEREEGEEDKGRGNFTKPMSNPDPRLFAICNFYRTSGMILPPEGKTATSALGISAETRSMAS